MKAIATTAGLSAMVMSLALPALLLAQEPTAEPDSGPVAVAGATQAEAVETAGATQAQAVETADQGAAPATSLEAKRAAATVDMQDYKFVPKTVTVDAGDTITWRNIGEEDHDADGDGGIGTGTVVPGTDETETFDSAGTFKYVCTFHPNMKGTVVVDDSGGATGEDDKGDGGVGPTTTTTPPASSSGSDSSGSGSSSGSLPSTGENEIPLIIVGAGLLVCGLLTGAVAYWRWQGT